MKTAIFRAIVLFALTFSISACGNKGDLYMPEKDKEATEVEQSSK